MLEENNILSKVTLFHAGTDEVGRGCLAGPVAACAVILKSDILHSSLRDSKKLTRLRREELALRIAEIAEIGYAEVSVEMIDKINILQASLTAMRLAVGQLSIPPETVWVDGNQLPKEGFGVPAYAVIGGDGLIPQISAASIIAKVRRDALMREYHAIYPQYGFDKHVGYGVKAHIEAIAQHGLTPIHRKSFKIKNR